MNSLLKGNSTMSQFSEIGVNDGIRTYYLLKTCVFSFCIPYIQILNCR